MMPMVATEAGRLPGDARSRRRDPPDPTWFAGLWDDDDYDDVVLAAVQAVASAEVLGHLALLLGVSILLLSFNFSSRQLLTNDDTRFPVMARDVLTNGH